MHQYKLAFQQLLKWYFKTGNDMVHQWTIRSTVATEENERLVLDSVVECLHASVSEIAV